MNYRIVVIECLDIPWAIGKRATCIYSVIQSAIFKNRMDFCRDYMLHVPLFNSHFRFDLNDFVFDSLKYDTIVPLLFKILI